MTIIRHSEKIDKKMAVLMAMSREEYDQYMCKKYPDIFRERNLPMSQTCMCWSFCINKGWYYILDNLCEKLESISRLTGIKTYFIQIKEKFGGARFYHSSDIIDCKMSPSDKEFWYEIIDDLISTTEESCSYICAECGGYREKMITIGSWVYDICEPCFRKLKPDCKEIDFCMKKLDVKAKVLDAVYYASDDDLDNLSKISDKVIEDFKEKFKVKE
jgi:hypothetical protein